MKISASNRAPRAFTFVELMVVVAIFSMLILATVATQMFGLRMYRISEGKLLTTADARNTVSHIGNEIRSAKLLYIGNGNDYASFTPVADFAPRIGNALKICSSTDTNSFVFYYWETN